ncbi:MAG: hypothetical protein HPY54_11320 [Chthonomonadetes bacterium]|nr:hypothetical protein [Chthonomonadetes bacterium]
MANLWRLVRSEAGDAAWNMAVDEAILEAVLAGEQPPTVRFYRWRSPSVSLGRFQKAEKALNLALCRERGVQVVGRLTGGKAVLHGHDLTLSVVAPLHSFMPAHRVVEVHLRIVHALAEGFRLLGIDTRPVSRTDRRDLHASSANCFDHALPGDLTTPDGVKLAGGAQYRRGDVVLEQISIPFQPLPDALRGCLQGWKEPAPSPLIGVAEDALIQALCAGIARQFGVEWNPAPLSANELALANRFVEGYGETAGETLMNSRR